MDVGSKHFNERFGLSTFDRSGGQVRLIIDRGFPDLGDSEVIVRYFAFRFFIPSKLNLFLEGVTNIEIEPLTGLDS